jgi:hypothetical protein
LVWGASTRPGLDRWHCLLYYYTLPRHTL